MIAATTASAHVYYNARTGFVREPWFEKGIRNGVGENKHTHIKSALRHILILRIALTFKRDQDLFAFGWFKRQIVPSVTVRKRGG